MRPFQTAREQLDRWLDGESPDLSCLAGEISADDLLRLLALYPPSELAGRENGFLKSAFDAIGESADDHAVAAMTTPIAKLAELPTPSSNGSLAHCIVATRKLREAPQEDEKNISRAAFASRDRFFCAIARLSRSRRLTALDRHVEAWADLDRLRESIGKIPGGDVIEALIDLQEAVLHERADGDDAMSRLIRCTNDERLPRVLRDRITRRCARALTLRHFTSSALALRLSLAHRVRLQTTSADGRRLLSLATNLVLAGQIEAALEYVTAALRHLESDSEALAEKASARALTAIIGTRMGDSAAAGHLDMAESLAEQCDSVEPGLFALMRFAQATIVHESDSVDAAIRVIDDALKDIDRTQPVGPWAGRLAALRVRLLHEFKADRDRRLHAINEAALFAARVNDLDTLRATCFARARLHAEMPEEATEALDACAEAKRLTEVMLQSFTTDRELLLEILPKDPTLRLVLSSMVDKSVQQTADELETLFELSSIVVEQARRGHELMTAIEQTQMRTARILGSLPLVTWTSLGKTSDFAAVYMDGAVDAIYGHDSKKMIDLPKLWLDAVNERDREGLIDALATVERTLVGDEREFRANRADGETRWVAISIRPLLGEDDGCLYGIMTDITERRLLQQEVQAAQKMDAVGRLAGGIAHDFNNVLGGILSAANLLCDSLDDRSRSLDLVRIIERLALDGAETVSRIRAFASQPTGEAQVADLAVVASETVKMAHHIIGRSVEVEYRGPATGLGTNMHTSSMTQTLINLIVNAADAEPRNGKIVVETFENDTQVGVRVIDSGKGMDEVTLERAFEPFFTTRLDRDAAGLGLTMVYRTVTEAKGEILVDSTPGSGTTFSLLFPAVELPETELDDTSGEARSRASGRLLLVDDDELALRVTRMILEEEGFEVTTATDGEKGLEAYRECVDDWSLIVTDVRMPRCDGFQFVRQVRQGSDDPPILIMTGYADEQPEAFARLYPNVGFIRKPFTATNFLRMASGMMTR